MKSGRKEEVMKREAVVLMLNHDQSEEDITKITVNLWVIYFYDFRRSNSDLLVHVGTKLLSPGSRPAKITSLLMQTTSRVS